MRAKALLVLAASIVMSACSSGGVDEETFDQITVGMSRSKVEELLGAGEEQTSGGHGISAGGVLSGSKQPTNEKTFLWKDGSRQIIVEFKDGVVTSKRKLGF